MRLQQDRLKAAGRKTAGKAATAGKSAAVKAPSDALQRAWIALQRVAPILEGHVADALKAAGLPGLDWYTVLWELERAGSPQRPRDLAIPLFVERYHLSRLVDRMESDGLVKRIACKEDARGHLIDLTNKGRAVRREMWTVYGPAMAEAMNRIMDKDALKLAELLNKLAPMDEPLGDCGEK